MGHPRPGDFILLPSRFVPDHATGGLPGYPARDFFGRPGALVLVDFYGRVRRVSGRAPSQGGSPGGSYGRSLYIQNAGANVERYVTHLDALAVSVGDFVSPGTIVGTIADSAVSGKPGTSHVHMGERRGT